MDQNMQPQPPKPLQDPGEKDKSERVKRNILYVIIAIILLSVAGGIIYNEVKGPFPEGSWEKDIVTSVTFFLPIWVVLFIPLLTKKDRPATKRQRAIIVGLVIGLTALVALGIAAWLYYANK